jgi:glycosyltransferase involved in cell wall biosynthesis
LTKLYGLDVAVAGVAEAQRRGVDIRFTMLGEGPEANHLRHISRQLCKPGTVTLEAPIAQGALRARLGQCAVGIVPTRLDRMTRYSLSTKLLEYVHLGLPVLAARLPSYQAYFTEDMLWYWNQGDPTDLARAIAEFSAAGQRERSIRAERARQALEPLSWVRERAGLLTAYARLLSSR